MKHIYFLKTFLEKSVTYVIITNNCIVNFYILIILLGTNFFKHSFTLYDDLIDQLILFNFIKTK